LQYYWQILHVLLHRCTEANTCCRRYCEADYIDKEGFDLAREFRTALMLCAGRRPSQVRRHDGTQHSMSAPDNGWPVQPACERRELTADASFTVLAFHVGCARVWLLQRFRFVCPARLTARQQSDVPYCSDENRILMHIQHFKIIMRIQCNRQCKRFMFDSARNSGCKHDYTWIQSRAAQDWSIDFYCNLCISNSLRSGISRQRSLLTNQCQRVSMPVDLSITVLRFTLNAFGLKLLNELARWHTLYYMRHAGCGSIWFAFGL